MPGKTCSKFSSLCLRPYRRPSKPPWTEYIEYLASIASYSSTVLSTRVRSNVKAIQKINEAELQLGVGSKSSWHDQYKDSAYVFIGRSQISAVATYMCVKYKAFIDRHASEYVEICWGILMRVVAVLFPRRSGLRPHRGRCLVCVFTVRLHTLSTELNFGSICIYIECYLHKEQ